MSNLQTHAMHAKTCAEYIPCNVSGVVFSFAAWMQYACDSGMGTKERNEHAITKAYMIGLNSMGFNLNDLEYSEVIGSLETILKQGSDK